MSVGFIMLRHVDSEITDNYWKKCYDCIRSHHPENRIVIIDDNSNFEFLTHKKLYKTITIHGDYSGRGELLPYYYFLNNKLFDIAVILHDSVFLNKPIDLNVYKYRFLWSFNHKWDKPKDEEELINIYNDLELRQFYKDKKKWKGFFGGMSIITHDYLTFVNSQYDISKLLGIVLTRKNRMSLERVLACIFIFCSRKKSYVSTFEDSAKATTPIFGDIEDYWDYKNEIGLIRFIDKDTAKKTPPEKRGKKNKKILSYLYYNHLPANKDWTGR